MEDAGSSDELKSRMLFDKFISTCKQKEQTVDMEKIIKKTNGYYRKAKPEYIKSLEFQKLVALKIDEICRDPRRIYVYMKDVVDEIRSRKQKPTSLSDEPPSKKQKLSNNDTGEDDDSKNTEKEKNEEGQKIDIETIANRAESRYTERRVRKLSKALKRINSVIKKLEEKEVDFDEDNDSTYIKLEKYKERFCKVHQKLCELTGDTTINKLSRKIEFSGTDSQEINRCIERFVNKTGQFPDFHDILKLVKTVQTDKHMKPEALRRLAEKAFLSVGRQLQKKRQFESWDSLSVFLRDQNDPAEENLELETLLQKNSEQSANRIQEIIDTFAEKQIKDNLEAEEVPDEVANKSEESGQEGETEEGEEGEDEDEEDEDKDYVDKLLREEEGEGEEEDDDDDDDDDNDDDNCLDQDVEMDEEGEEDELRDLGSSDEEHSRSDRSNSNFESEISKNREISLQDNLVSVKRNLGPVSPPVLGEVITDIDFMSSPAAVQDDCKPEDSSQLGSKVEDEGCLKEKEVSENVQVDDLSKSVSQPEPSVPVCSEETGQSEEDSKVLECPRGALISVKNIDTLRDPKHSENGNLEDSENSELTSSQEVSVIIDTNNSTKKNICRSLKSKSSVSSSDSLKSEKRDSLSPSLLETIEEDNSKSSENKSDKKFVVTKIEMGSSSQEYSSLRNKIGRQKLKQKPHFSKVIISPKVSSECVDVITLE